MKYKLKDLLFNEKEIKEFRDNYSEFLKTTYGKSVKLIQDILGIFFTISFILILIFVTFLEYGIVFISDEISIIIFMLFAVVFLIGFFAMMISEMIFRSMLMNYVNSKK